MPDQPNILTQWISLSISNSWMEQNEEFHYLFWLHIETINQLQLLLFVTLFNNQVCFDNFDISGSIGEQTIISFHRIGARKLTLLEHFSKKHFIFSNLFPTVEQHRHKQNWATKSEIFLLLNNDFNASSLCGSPFHSVTLEPHHFWSWIWIAT